MGTGISHFSWEIFLLVMCILPYVKSCDPSRQYPAPTIIEARYNPEGNSISIRWEDSKGNASMFYYLRITQGIKQRDKRINKKSYTINNVEINATYVLTLIGYRKQKYSVWSEPVSLKTLPYKVVFQDGDRGWITLNGPSKASQVWCVKMNGKVLSTITECKLNKDRQLYVYHDMKLLDDCQTLNISFRSVSSRIAGIYEVELQRNSTRLYAKTVIVTARPSTPIIEELDDAVVDLPLKLKCSSHSNSKPEYHDLHLSYTWQVNRKNVSEFNASSKYQIDGNLLTISKLDHTDRTNLYSCFVIEEQGLKSYPGYKTLERMIYGAQSVNIYPDRNITMIAGANTTSIICTADCYPECDILWRRKGFSDAHFEPVLSTKGNILDLRPIDRSGAGVYKCIAMASSLLPANQWFRSTNIVVNIQSVPDPPSNFTAPVILNSIVILQWTPNNDGGLKQLFRVDIKDTSTTGGWRIVESDMIETHKDQAMFLNVKNLLPMTSYSFRLYAVNKLGSSKMVFLSLKTNAQATGRDQHTPFDFEQAVFKFGFIIESVIILMMCVCIPIIIKCMKNRQAKGKSHLYDSPSQKYEIPQYENTVELQQRPSQRDNELNRETYENIRVHGNDNAMNIYEN